MFCVTVHDLIAHALTFLWIRHSLKKIQIHHWDLLPDAAEMPSQILFCFLTSCSDMNDYATLPNLPKNFTVIKVFMFIIYSSLLFKSLFCHLAWPKGCDEQKHPVLFEMLYHPVWLSTTNLAACRSHVGQVLRLLTHIKVCDCLGCLVWNKMDYA